VSVDDDIHRLIFVLCIERGLAVQASASSTEEARVTEVGLEERYSDCCLLLFFSANNTTAGYDSTML
jgi:hypothetical protein